MRLAIDGFSVCGARQPLRPAKRARVLPTAAHTTPLLFPPLAAQGFVAPGQKLLARSQFLHQCAHWCRPFESLIRPKRKTTPKGGVFFLAEDEGFEPPQTESESGVLPLHKSSMCQARILLYALWEKCQEYFSKNSKYFPQLQFARYRAFYSASQGKGFPFSRSFFM